MVYYDTSRMLVDLGLLLDQIPNRGEQQFIQDCLDRRKGNLLTMPQYNKILDLYNKYIALNAAITQIAKDKNYGSS